MDFINNNCGKKEHFFSRVASYVGLDAETQFLQKFKEVGDFWPERKESILFITAGVDDGSGLGNMKIKDSSYNHDNVRMAPIGRWNDQCNYPRMKQYIKRRYDTCPDAFSDITDPLVKPLEKNLRDTKGLLTAARNTITSKQEIIDVLREDIQDRINKNKDNKEELARLNELMEKTSEKVGLPIVTNTEGNEDNFAPFKNVEHLTMRDKANMWVEQQNIIRRDYISRLDNIQSEVDLDIEDTLNNVNKLSNYKTLVLITLFIIKTVILVILLFIGWFAIKMIRERDS